MNKNIITAILYLKEASELLKYELPPVSTCLLELTLQMLEQYKIDNKDILSAQASVDSIMSKEA